MPIGERLCDFEGSSQEIEPFPPKPKNFSDPHAREYGRQNDCTTRFGEILEQHLNLRGR